MTVLDSCNEENSTFFYPAILLAYCKSPNLQSPFAIAQFREKGKTDWSHQLISDLPTIFYFISKKKKKKVNSTPAAKQSN